MIKKLTLTSLTALSLLLVTAQAEGTMKCNGGKCGAGMMKQVKQGGKMHKKGKHSPFLIKRGLPHLSKMIMKNWDDATLALTTEQKESLTKVRQETMRVLKEIKPQIGALAKEIVQGSKAGTKASELKSKVEKLALLQAKATMTQLKCLDNTKAILKPEQLDGLMKKRKAQRQMKKGMKCASGKCGKK